MLTTYQEGLIEEVTKTLREITDKSVRVSEYVKAK